VANDVEHIDIAIIGAGPAGLMAAETLTNAGLKPVLFDAMPTPARKFLMAGKSGLNLTHSEPLEHFLTRYGDKERHIQPAITEFTPIDLKAWADELGAETFVGSSGRVFPKIFKASPLLRNWLAKLSDSGAELRTRHRWQGWGPSNCHKFETPEGVSLVSAKATIFAFGGISWPKLGGNGNWVKEYEDNQIQISPFRPTNCGFEANWSDFFLNKFAGAPVKNCLLSVGNTQVKGDFVISQYGVEGSSIYRLSAPLRDLIAQSNSATTLTIDLLPDTPFNQVIARLSKPRGKKSIATHLKKSLSLQGVKSGLLRECTQKQTFDSPDKLASAIKALPLSLTAPRPIEEAISVAGGVSFDALDDNLMLREKFGQFCAGEMLDWEAPTGGYLLTACFAQGKQAATGVMNYLKTL
jgi:uncharacterized flavoprotein (TIGR03862 family)